MSESTEVIGIDFGTTHTHVSLGSAISRESQSFGKSRLSAILYQNGEYSGCGDEALEEYVDYAHDGHYDLRVNFKPQIESDTKAADTAACFLQEITKGITDKTSKKTLVGVPAGATPGFQSVLKNLMRSSFGDVETISEPLGALVHFQESGRLSTSELINDLLVIDFGGGTCDFAYTRGGKVYSVPMEKGNSYGGRLFDDLFFQWWEKKNPDEAKECDERDKNFIFVKKSRDAKEAFSIRMANKRDAEFIYREFLGHGALRNLTWADFEERAKNYCPSERLLKSAKGLLDGLCAKPEESINLLERFRDLLNAAKKHYLNKYGDDSRFKWVLLAGGSSLWPFVKDYVKEILNVFDDDVLMEPDPYSTIALGLAQIPYRRKALADKKKKLEEYSLGSGGKSREAINASLETLKNNFTDFCAGDHCDSIWSNYIKPIESNYIQRKIDGKEFKRQLEAKQREIQRKMTNYWEERSKRALEYLPHRLRKELQNNGADTNCLTLPRRFQVDFSGIPFEGLINTLLPEGSEISFFTGVVNMLLKPVKWIYKFFIYFFKDKEKRAKDERKKLKEAQARFKEKVEDAVEEVFTKGSIQNKLFEQIKAPVKQAIDNIELLQSQI